MNMNINIKLNY